MNYAFALKVPDIILSQSVDPDLREIIEDYVVKILNQGRYVISVSRSGVSSSTSLDSGALMMDDSGVSKYIVVSNGTTNYRVEVSAIP